MKTKPRFKQPDGFKPGIYLDLPNDTYHLDKALSHSGMVQILESPIDYWETGPLNPLKSKWKVTSDAMKMGIWTEMALLEPQKFEDTHVITGPGQYGKKKVIPAAQYEDVVQCVKRIRRLPEASAYFTNGFPQVSIFWVDKRTGIRMRIRIDYMRWMGGIDYKRIKNIHGNPLGWIISDRGYDLQDMLYRTGIAEAKEGLRNGTMKIHCRGDFDKAWFKKFMDDQRALFTFCFQRSTAPFPFVIQELDDEILSQSRVMMENATDLYKYNIERYGEAEWPSGSIMPEPFSMFHMPKRFLDRGVHQL